MPCTPNCGSCCDPVSLSHETANRLYAFGPAQPQAAWAWEHWSPVAPDGNDGVHLVCINYDPQSRACLDYDNRPPVCREFPFYGRDPNEKLNTLSRVCGYQAELGRTVLPLVQVT